MNTAGNPNNLIIWLVLLIALLLMMILLFTSSNRRRKEEQNRANALDKEKRKLEAELKLANAINLDKTNSLMSISHDIRFPIDTIREFSRNTLLDIDDREKAISDIRKIESANRLLLGMMEDINDAASLFEKAEELSEDKGDVMLLFAGAQLVLDSLAASKGINLSFDFGEIKDRYVYCDMSRAERLFINLASNAIENTGRGGYVKVSCSQTSLFKEGNPIYQYIFEDNGTGIKPDLMARIEDEFAKKSTSLGTIQNIGRGLAVSKDLVDLMGGTIVCESTEGVGTKFIIYLPFKLQSGEEYIDPVDGYVVRKNDILEGKRCLICEGNEISREITYDILRELGLDVDMVSDGEEAVSKVSLLGPEYYDFILMDIQMPRMGGYEANSILKSRFPDGNFKVVALSAFAFEEDRRQSLKEGMDEHLAKPIEVQKLIEILEKFAKN